MKIDLGAHYESSRLVNRIVLRSSLQIGKLGAQWDDTRDAAAPSYIFARYMPITSPRAFLQFSSFIVSRVICRAPGRGSRNNERSGKQRLLQMPSHPAAATPRFTAAGRARVSLVTERERDKLNTREIVETAKSVWNGRFSNGQRPAICFHLVSPRMTRAA